MHETPRSKKKAFRQGISERTRKPSRQAALDEDAQKIQDEIKAMMENMNNPTEQPVRPPPLPISPDSGHVNFNRTMVYLNSLVGKLNSLNEDFFMDFTDITNASLSDIRKKQRVSEEKEADQQEPEQLPPPPTTCVRFKDGSIGYKQGNYLTKCRLEDAPVYEDDVNGLVVDVTNTMGLDLRQMAVQSVKDQGLIDANGNYIVDGNANYSVKFAPGLQFPHTAVKHNHNFVADTEQSQ